VIGVLDRPAVAEEPSPEFNRGWNAAMSHAESYLVGLAYKAGDTKDGGVTAKLIRNVLMQVAETVGSHRKPQRRSYG
jgi:hypothetical protein